MHIATKSSKIDISLENNTRLVSNEVSQFLKRGDIFFLYGEIGVGKSTFIKYLINCCQVFIVWNKVRINLLTQLYVNFFN